MHHLVCDLILCHLVYTANKTAYRDHTFTSGIAPYYHITLIMWWTATYFSIQTHLAFIATHFSNMQTWGISIPVMVCASSYTSTTPWYLGVLTTCLSSLCWVDPVLNFGVSLQHAYQSSSLHQFAVLLSQCVTHCSIASVSQCKLLTQS